MTVEETRFITEMLQAIRGDIAGLDKRFVSVELRQTAMEQQLLGVNTHLVALQNSIDHLSFDMRRVKQRLELADA
ncbi:hypothetical protein [uncultured Sphingomonas sp.]|uniref:hypothetical protein n=1 Tax=uncultured Sphingomonas sp. TaxID=158754 RepID=UPI002616B23A|nr:hypothetical protein [uncultured Sphingomonas sp.]